MESKIRKVKKSGFSLIELLLVLTVTALFLVAAFMIYDKISVAQKESFLISELTSIQAQIIDTFDNKGFDCIKKCVKI